MRTVVVGRRPGQPPREAQVQLRWAPVQVAPPARTARSPPNGASEAPAAAVALWAVLVEEPAPPPLATTLHWVLLTSWPVTTATAASDVARWYALRWLIEWYHYVLKSGCGIEHLQLGRADALERALAVYSLVAWRLLWLTYQARQTPATPTTAALSGEEWQTAYLATHPGAPVPTAPPSLHDVVRWIAKLGGFLGRRGDGEPGVTTLWRGWRRLQDLVAGRRLAPPLAPPPP